MDTRYRSMIGHGAIVIFLGLACGFGLVMSLIGGFEIIPGKILEFTLFGDSGAWARAHVGGLLNGIFIIAVAVAAHLLVVSESTSKHLQWMMIGTGYANTAFYWGALLSQNRALTFGDNQFGAANLASVLGLLPALIFAVVTMVAMVLLARAAFSR